MFDSEMIIGNGCRENIDHSITQSERCHTKGKKNEKDLAKFNKTSWMDAFERLMNIC